MVIFSSPTYSWLRVQHLDRAWCSVREVSLHWSLNKSESSLMQRIHHENMNRVSHPSVDGRGALLHEWAGWLHACKWRLDTQTHPSPHSCAEKCEWGCGSWRWNGIPPSSTLPAWIPVLSSSCSNQIGARRSCDATIRPPTQHTHGRHTYTHTSHVHTLFPSHTCALPPLPPSHILPACMHIPLHHKLTLQSAGGSVLYAIVSASLTDLSKLFCLK